jgi:hypothetical protein
MKSPCHDCKLRDTDKNNSICIECDKRVAYVAALGGFPAEPETEKRRGVMSKIGACNNCEREGLSLAVFGRCWLCYDAARQAKEAGASVEAALAAAKERIKSGVNLKSRAGTKKGKTATRPDSTVSAKKKLRQAAADIMAEETINILKEAPGWLAPNGIGVCLEFKDDRDKGILNWIEELATEHRRNPEQQIMWILQDYIDTANRLAGHD